MPVPITVKGAGLTVELLLFRAYGRKGNTEAMLDKATAINPGLAGRKAILPQGTAFLLPDLDTSPIAAATTPTAVSIFGD